MTADMRERLIVGLDVPTVREAEAIVRKLDDEVTFYKIGYQLPLPAGWISPASWQKAAGRSSST